MLKLVLAMLLCTCSGHAVADETLVDFASTATLGSRNRAVHVFAEGDGRIIAVVVLGMARDDGSSRNLARRKAELILEQTMVNYAILSPRVGEDWQAVANELSRRDGGFSTTGTLGPGVAYRTLKGLPDDRFAMEATTTIDNISLGKRPAQTEIDQAHRRVILGDMLAGRDRSAEDISRVLDDINRMIDASGGEPSRMPPRKLGIMAALVHVKSGNLESAKQLLDGTSRAKWDLAWADLEQLVQVERGLGNMAVAEAIESVLGKRDSNDETGLDPRVEFLCLGGEEVVPVGVYGAKIGDQQWLLGVAEVIEMDFRDGEPGWLRPVLRSQMEAAFNKLLPSIEYDWRLGGLVESNDGPFGGPHAWTVFKEIDQSTPEATVIRYLLATRMEDAPSQRADGGETIKVIYREPAPGLSSVHEAVRAEGWNQFVADHFQGYAELLRGRRPTDDELVNVFPVLDYTPSSYGEWVVEVDMSAARDQLLGLLPAGSIELAVAVSPWNTPATDGGNDGSSVDSEWETAIRACIAERLESWPAVKIKGPDAGEASLAVVTIGPVQVEEGELPSRYAGGEPRRWSIACRELEITLGGATGTARACTQRHFGTQQAKVTPDLAAAMASKVLLEMDLETLRDALLANGPRFEGE
ncbi:MAG: hypothetical protein CMJ36_00360 [Phycisphaerae bacterium]|nr:hypothetical protein [Phycisphaerae bacterium]